jgi:hypothetical protein
MKTSKTRLRVSRETLRELGADDLGGADARGAAGNGVTSLLTCYTQCNCTIPTNKTEISNCYCTTNGPVCIPPL